MTNGLSHASAVILALAFPLGALADASGSLTLAPNTNFSFDNGTTGSSGGDIRWTGAEIAYVGTATGASFGAQGAAAYNNLDQYFLASFYAAGIYNTNPIISLAAGEIFAVHTNGGNFAKVLFISASGAGFRFQYVTYGASATGGAPIPTISTIGSAGSYVGPLAQGSIFVVKGSGLSASGYVQTSFPLPTSSGGVSIAFTPAENGNAIGTNAYLVSLYNQNGVNQLAAIVPSTLSTGSYLVTVTNNGVVSTGANADVVAAQPGLITQDSAGNGLVVAQNYVSAAEVDINHFTTGSVNGSSISPAHPGQTLIAWLTGLGPLTTGDNIAALAYNFAANGANVQVYVGGISIAPFYAGRAPGLAGVDQIDFTLPDNVPTGCTVGFQVSENGMLSQSTFIAIAPSATATACVQPGYTTSQLQAFDNGATITAGYIGVYQGSAGGYLTEFTGFELPDVPPASTTAPSGCTVTVDHVPAPPAAPGTTVSARGIALDAGTLTLNGPPGSGFSNVTLPVPSNGNYFAIVPGGQGNVLAGAYTLTGAGGKDIGPFSATVNLPAPPIFGSFPSVVNRSSDLTLTWTGGDPSDTIQISGQALNTVNGVQTGAAFFCNTTASAGTYTVRSSILNQLPAANAAPMGSSTGYTHLGLTWTSTPSGSNGLFSAPLTAGGVLNGMFTGQTSAYASPSYQ